MANLFAILFNSDNWKISDSPEQPLALLMATFYVKNSGQGAWGEEIRLYAPKLCGKLVGYSRFDTHFYPCTE